MHLGVQQLFPVLELDKLITIQLCYCAGRAYLYWAYPGA